jgi:hypothetical protein
MERRAMTIEREAVVEAGISIAAVAVFIVAVVLVGLQFGTSGSAPTLTPTGGLGILAAIVFFLIVMTGVGWWLANRDV